MALTTTHRVATASTSNATSYTSGSFTPSAGEILVVWVVATGCVLFAQYPRLTSSVSLSFTRVAMRATKNSSADSLYCFISDQFTTNVSQTVTFTCTGTTASGAIIAVESVAGMLRTGCSGAVRQVSGTDQAAKQDNGAASGTPAVTFANNCLTGNAVQCAVANATSPATMTPPTSFTELWDSTGYSTPTTGMETAKIDSGFTSTTVTWGGTSASAFCAMAIELDASAPVPPVETLGPSAPTFYAGP